MLHSNHTQDETESPEDPGKQPLNILTLISELYNFQVVSCLLIYDLIKGFIDDLGTSGSKGEFAVEGILRVLRCESGSRSFQDGSLADAFIYRLRIAVAIRRPGRTKRHCCTRAGQGVGSGDQA